MLISAIMGLLVQWKDHNVSLMSKHPFTLSTTGRGLRVCMLVANDMVSDPRVTRHAETLGCNGFKVTVVCFQSQGTVARETRENHSIIRVSGRIIRFAEILSRMGRRPTTRTNTGNVNGSVAPRTRKGVARLLVVVAVIALRQLALFRAARKTGAHVYCANDLDTLPAAILAAGFDRKVVYDAHELWPEMITAPPFYRKIARTFEGFLARRVDLVMTVNEMIANVLASRYSINLPIHIYNCPRVGMRKRAVRRTRKRGPKVVLYQGVYHPQRGLENLVKASRLLLSDVRLVLRGYGAIENQLRELARGMTNVSFVPPVPMERLVDAARVADVGIVPYLPTNLNNYLASPNKLFEYIHAGLPVAASNMPFARKLVEENGIGVVFDARDVRSIAQGLNRITRPSQLRRFQLNLIAAAAKYNWQVEALKLLRSYAQFRDAFQGGKNELASA